MEKKDKMLSFFREIDMAGLCQKCFHPQGMHVALNGSCVETSCSCKDYIEYTMSKLKKKNSVRLLKTDNSAMI